MVFLQWSLKKNEKQEYYVIYMGISQYPKHDGIKYF